MRIAFGILCVVGSVALYHARGVRKWWFKRRQNGGKGDANVKIAPVVNLAPVAASGADVEASMAVPMAGTMDEKWNHNIGTVGNGKADRCSIPIATNSAGLPKSKIIRVYIIGLLLGITACYLNSIDWYTPVLFAYFSVFFAEADYGDSAFGDSVSKAASAANAALLGMNKPGASSANNMPNVIYLQHESLSGSIMFNTEEGIKATPWFNKMKNEDPNFYVFENGRTISGLTIDAMPALMTGCAPYSKKGIDWVHTKGRAIGYDFFNRGYSTASFSSRALDKTTKSGQWSMLYDLLVGAMEYVVDPTKMKWTFDNSEGSDDRKMLPKFEEWLMKLGSNETTSNAPVYAQFYNFNLHYPYLKDPEKPSFSHRVYDGLATTDEFLQRLFEILEKSGRLENTIIVGSGDHGEDPFKDSYVRLSALNSNVLHAAQYIYYPQHLMPDPSSAERLRMNTQKMTHTLDMYPTIQSILHGGPYDYLQHADQDCITGIDLASVVIPDDRVAITWNLVSSQIVRKQPAEFWALSTRDSDGKDWSLYHRLSRNRHPKLKQGANNFYVLEYGDCTRDTNPKNLCMMNVNQEHKELFRGAVQWIKHTPLLGEGVGKSKLVKFFAEEVGWKEAGEIAVVTTDDPAPNAMGALPQQLEAVATADDSDLSDERHQAGSKSKGFFSSLVQSFQDAIGTRSVDLSCDDILLFMPNRLAPIAIQMNGYLRAAMMATFANKALVVMDAPQELICNVDGYAGPPLGLPNIIKSPEWLTRECAIPCQASHSYVDWNGIRLNMHLNDLSSTPFEHVCMNENGRESRVFPIGGDEIHNFFESNFKEQMLQRPSPSAYEWALRLGATEPQEAELFAQLEGDTMWDYLGALLMRNEEVLHLQSDVAKDVAKLMKSRELDTRLPYDAIDVRRGDAILDRADARNFAINYWDAQQGKPEAKEPHNYIPLIHYLRHYYDRSEEKCIKDDNVVIISTNAPGEVRKEIDALSRRRWVDGDIVSVRPKRCLAFKFVISTPRKRDVSPGKDESCTDRYDDLVADIADFITMQKANTFVGEFHSDWGRLVRTSRLMLNKAAIEEGSHNNPVLLKDMNVAWGYLHPGPPGW